jgi:cyclic nucleotide-binding protein
MRRARSSSRKATTRAEKPTSFTRERSRSAKRIAGGERRLNLVNEGELLGEMALFRKAPRSASAVAVTDAELLVVQNERLGWLIRNRPELTIELLKRLSDQMVSRDTDPGAPPGEPSPPPDPPGTGRST